MTHVFHFILKDDMGTPLQDCQQTTKNRRLVFLSFSRFATMSFIFPPAAQRSCLFMVTHVQILFSVGYLVFWCKGLFFLLCTFQLFAAQDNAGLPHRLGQIVMIWTGICILLFWRSLALLKRSPLLIRGNFATEIWSLQKGWGGVNLSWLCERRWGEPCSRAHPLLRSS